MSALGVGDFIERVTEDSADVESSMGLFFAVYALFICFTLIILMNILIAMLSNRYLRDLCLSTSAEQILSINRRQ